MIRRIAALAAVLFLAAVPARAGANRFDLQVSAVQTATGNGGGINVAGAKELLVFVSCTANVGTPVLDVYLQASSDGGTTWYDIVADWAVATTNPAAAAEGQRAINQRSILDGFSGSCSTPVLYAARYTVFGDYVRAAWVMSGSTSYTFGVKAIAKN